MLRRCTGTSVMSAPPTRMRPASGVSKPAIMRSVVVLPHPDGPSRAKNSPAAIVRSTPSTARTRPSKLLLRPSSVTADARSLTDSSALQQPSDPRINLVLALVVPFPVDLDELRDLGLGVVELG